MRLVCVNCGQPARPDHPLYPTETRNVFVHLRCKGQEQSVRPKVPHLKRSRLHAVQAESR